MALVLSFIGIALFITGVIEVLRQGGLGAGLFYWFCGLIFAIPGFFFTYKVWQAFTAEDKSVRQSILQEIPDM